MRDNWMTHPGYSAGDGAFEISHTMLVERLQFLPGNQVEGNQTVMARAILGDDASTNLVAHVFVMGSEPASEGAEGGSLLGVAVVGLSLMVVLLLVMLTLAVLHIREDSDWGEDEPEDEIEEELPESS